MVLKKRCTEQNKGLTTFYCVRISRGGGRGFALRSLRPHVISPPSRFATVIYSPILELEISCEACLFRFIAHTTRNLIFEARLFGLRFIERGILYLERAKWLENRGGGEVTGAKWPVAVGSIPRAGPILRVLKWVRNKGTLFALQTARPSRGSDVHVTWRSRLRYMAYICGQK